MKLATLQRGLNRERWDVGAAKSPTKVGEVKVIGESGAADREGLFEMSVVLA
jgi:hypothetical protein